MARSNDAWGLEVGANALKAVRLVDTGDEVEVADFEVIPFKTILTTPDLNVDLEIQSILDQFTMRHDVTKSQLVVSVPGNLAFARFAKLPPVEPKKIPEIVKFEAQQQIPFPIDQVEWDYQVFMQEDSPDVDVGIFAIAKERALGFLSNYDERNIKIDALTLSPVAVYNAMAYELNLENESDATIIMDIGTTSTDLVIVDQGRVWLRTMQIGGNNFTEALVKSFKLSFPKAEKLKREAGTSKYARQIFQAMRPVFNDLVQEIQKSLGFYQTTNRDAELSRLVGLGSTFRLPGLSKFLKQQLSLEVIRPDKYKKISIDGKRASEFAEAALNMGTAYGLALQGLGLAPIKANIMPEHIVRQRLWKSKQPWIAAAAAVVLAATGAAYFSLSSAKSAYANEKQATEDIRKPVISKAKGFAGQIQNRQSDPRMRIENLNRILDYRDVWPKLVEDLGMATMALGPQQALLDDDPENEATIERGARKRVYIETVDAQYVVSLPKKDEKGQRGSANTGGYDFKGAADTKSLWSSTPSRSTSSSKSNNDNESKSNQPEPPSFVVTIRGTTPYQNNTPGFLSRHFLKWLKENFDRPDRPYEIVTEDVKLVSLEQITEEDLGISDDSNTGPAVRGVRGAPNPNGGGIVGVRRPGGIVRPSRPTLPDGESLPDGAEAPLDPVEILYPSRPEAETVQVGDYEFEITWTVRLLRPEDARRAREKTDEQTTPGKQANSSNATEVKS